MKRLSMILVSISIIIFALFGWSLVEPYTIDETAYTVALPNLPESWMNSEIAVISDIQVGMWLDNLSTVRRIVDRIIQRDPAAVLIAGDFIYHGGDKAVDRIETTVSLLQPLRDAGLPVVAVLGNHDYSVVNYENPTADVLRSRRIIQALEDISIITLENESMILNNTAGDPLSIVGIGSHMAHRDKPDQAFDKVSPKTARIVLMHNPTTFGALDPGVAPLALAGHTHGGQFRLPFTPSWTWITYFREEEIHTDGWIRDYGAVGNRLYVNRGIGFSIVPMRFNCPPEITWITLEGEGEGS